MAIGIAQNVGLTRLATLGIGGGGTAYLAAPATPTARIGVGNSATAPTSADGTILGTPVWHGCDAGFPNVAAGNKMVFQATYAAGSITLPIKEVVMDNGSVAREALARIVLDATEWVTPGGSDIPRVKVEFSLA
jgi:hypothetical protein